MDLHIISESQMERSRPDEVDENSSSDESVNTQKIVDKFDLASAAKLRNRIIDDKEKCVGDTTKKRATVGERNQVLAAAEDLTKTLMEERFDWDVDPVLKEML